MNYGEKIRIFLVFFASTLFLLIGIFTTIVVSGLYFSPVSKDFSLDTVNTYNNLIKEDMLIISEVLEDEKIEKNEKIKLKELSFYNYNFGKVKIISNTYRLTHQYSFGEIIHDNSLNNSFVKNIGNLTIKIVIFIKDSFLKNDYDNCVDFSFITFEDENLGSQYTCANNNLSTLRVYSSNLQDGGFIISTVLPIKNAINETLGFLQIITDARMFEEKLGKFLISVLSPLLFCMIFVALFILYLQKFLSGRIKVSFLNANNIAHNLKNKTNAIRYYSQKKLTTIDDAEKSLVKIKKVLDNLDNFIDDTLETAKNTYHNNSVPDKKSEVQFVEIINIIKDLYISKNIIFRGEYNYLILAEQYKLIDALTAIIDNSLYWNKANKPVIIEARKKINMLEINILDYGPGLNQKDKKHIFKEGFSKSNGNGIGLHIAKNIITSFDGEIIASNRNTEGLSMLVKLRLVKHV